MTDMITNHHPQRSIRLWPGVAVVILQWLLVIVPGIIDPDIAILGLLGGVACGVIVLVWWLFFSRAPWLERIGAIVLMVVAVGATRFVVDPSIAGAGMGRMLQIFSILPLSLALVAALVLSRNRSTAARRASTVAAILIACGAFTLIRTGGVNGGGKGDFHWRWTPTPEERLLAQAANEPVVPVTTASAPAAASPAEPAKIPDATAGKSVDPAPKSTAAATTYTEHTEAPGVAEWPGFRGAERDDVIRGVRIETDWTRTPPVEIWRKPIGPGWSSFAVQGDLIYTQEQRGDDELVSSYNLSTGAPVWRHKDAARFYESNGGPGPRATPAIGNGRVYALGATGILNALDARTGAVLWSRNAVTDTGATDSRLGHLGLAACRRRHRHRRRVRQARRVRCRDRQAAVVGTDDARRQLQLAASGDFRRR